MSERLNIQYEGKPCYEIVIESDFSKLCLELNKFSISQRKVCIVTESTVGSLYQKQIEELLSSHAADITCFTFPAGEKSKNLDTVQRLYTFLIEKKFDRLDMLIALGGGVVGDLTGYTAATYLRGIDFVQIPTSLLAEVDSSIGGKTGVDLQAYKNMVGAFYQPKLVYMNVNALRSLPEREYLSGMGEIIKHGLIRDRAYYQWISEHVDEIKQRDFKTLEQMIKWSCAIKRDVVERDPKEQGERALLNFGHTIGHAIERLKNFELLHGECVCIGMRAALFLSTCRKKITQTEYNAFLTLLKQLSLPVETEGISAEAIVSVSKNDKKMEHGVVKFILLDSIGHAVIDRSVTEEEMLAAAEECVSSSRTEEE